MSDQWQVSMSRKRRRSARKSGNKKVKPEDDSGGSGASGDSPSVSESVSQTVSVIHEANEALDDLIDELLDNSTLNMQQSGLPGTNMLAAGQPAPGTVTTSTVSSNMGTLTFTTAYHSAPLSNPFSVLSPSSSTRQSEPFSTFSASGASMQAMQPPPTGALPGQNGSVGINSNASNLSHMGVTDGSTALILSEIQAMRTGIVNDLSTHFRAEFDRMYNEIATGIDQRFKRMEESVAKVQEENAKLRQELGSVSVTGSLQGDTLDHVVSNTVEQAFLNKNVVTKKQFDYDVTIACPGVRYSADENIEEKAKHLVHVGLNLPDLKIVRAMRTPYQHHINRPGLMKIEFESVEVKKRVLSQSGRLRSWHDLGPKVIIRGSQTHDMRTQVANQVTFLKGTGLDSQFTVNKNGLLQAKPGSQAAANIQASNQMFQGNAYPNNPMYAPRPQPQPNTGSRFTYNNNPVYGPPPLPRASYGQVNNSVYTAHPPAQPQTYAQAAQQPPTSNVNPLLQFMSGLR